MPSVLLLERTGMGADRTCDPIKAGNALNECRRDLTESHRRNAHNECDCPLRDDLVERTKQGQSDAWECMRGSAPSPHMKVPLTSTSDGHLHSSHTSRSPEEGITLSS